MTTDSATTSTASAADERQPPAIHPEPIRWPDKYLPANTHVFASNQLLIDAPPEIVWAWLIRAGSWPDWYANSSNIHFRSTSGPDLRDRTRFAWTTFGIRVFSKVLEFEPCRRLAWESQGMGVHAYHTWLLTPQPDGSTHVLTQETQVGWLSRLVAKIIPTRVQTQHALWLKSLSHQARSGPPA